MESSSDARRAVAAIARSFCHETDSNRKPNEHVILDPATGGVSRVLKVFGTADERRELVQKYGSLADYDAFTLVEVGDAVARRLTRTHLVEDITGQYLTISQDKRGWR